MAPAMETRINGGYAKDTKPKNENKHNKHSIRWLVIDSEAGVRRVIAS
jgi:hypothetical protein